MSYTDIYRHIHLETHMLVQTHRHTFTDTRHRLTHTPEESLKAG